MATILAAIALLGLIEAGSVRAKADAPILVEDRFFGSFQEATRITVDQRGFLFVIDEGAHSVLIYDAPDHQPRTLGGYGWDQTTFDRPTGVATDILNIYVADFGNHRISRFDRQLSFLSSLSTRDTSYERARFGYPKGVALSRQGDLFVLDGENTRVVKFNAQGGFERSFGDTESPEGRLTNPVDLVVTRDERIFVLEPEKIVEYDYLGNFVGVMRSPFLSGARGFCEANKGLLVVTQDRLLFFNSSRVVAWSVDASHIVSSRPLNPLQDVAVRNNSVILLTPATAGIFRMVQPE